MRRLSDSARNVRNAFDSSSTYSEFKMKVGLLGADMYNIETLRTLRSAIRRSSVLRVFERDIDAHWNDGIEDYALDCISHVAANGGEARLPLFDSFICGMWLRRNKEGKGLKCPG